MKRPVLITIYALVFFGQTAYGQVVTEVSDITLGAGLSQGSNVGHLDNSELGITLQIYYGITENIRTGVGYTHYFIGEEGLGANEINIDGHYYFRNRDSVIVYGLGGINIARISADEEIWGIVRTRRLGINVGVGLEIELGSIGLFGEPKFTLAGFNQFLGTAGIRVRI